MLTRTMGLLGAGLALLLASGCSGGMADSGPPGGAATGQTAAAQKVYAEITALPKDQQRAKAAELARTEGALSLYTSIPEDVAGPLTQRFEQQFGVKVSIFRGNSETILQRTLQEGEADRLGADAIETNFREMTILAQQNQLTEFAGSALDKVGPEGRFDRWTATRFNLFLPAWNTNLIKPGEEPRSWEDLADPKYRGQITLELSDSDWYQNLTKYWLEHGKSQPEVDALWQGIVANSKVTKGHITMMELLGAGQTPMDAMNYSYITEGAKQKGAPVAYRLPDGTNPLPAFARPNGVGMLAGAQHPAAAWLFYDWMLTEGQQVLVEQHLTPSVPVPGDASLAGLNIVPFDVDTLTREGEAWSDRYDALLRGAAQVNP